MKKKLIIQKEIFFILSLITLFFTFLFKMFNLSTLASQGFYVLLFSLLITACFSLKRAVSVDTMLVFSISILSLFMTSAVCEQFHFTYFKKNFGFIIFLLLMLYIIESKFYLIHQKILFFMTLLWGVATSINYTLGFSGYLGKYVTLNLGNPNFTGMFLLHLCLLLSIFLFNTGNKILQCFITSILCFNIYLMFLTGSRASLLAFFIFIVCVLFFKRKLPLILVILMALTPIIFLFIYFAILNIQRILELLNVFASEGKELSSRFEIFSSSLTHYYTSPFLGVYNKLIDSTGFFQLHNIAIDTLTAYGPLVTLLFFFLIVRVLWRIVSEGDKKLNIYIYGFFAILINGCFEAALLNGGMGLFVLSLSFLMLAKIQCEPVTNLRRMS